MDEIEKSDLERVRKLAINKDPSAFNEILQLFKGQDKIHRMVAIEAFGYLEDPRALEYLEQVKKETQDEIKECIQSSKKIPKELESFYDLINESIKKISQKVLDTLF